MMYKKFILLLCSVLVMSCGTKKVGASKESQAIVLGKEIMDYKSLGNGVADISLKFYDNETFQFVMNSIPQERSDKSIRISEKGTYTSNGKWKELHFKNPKFSLEAIFDPQFSEGDDYRAIDHETVKFNTGKEAVSIWGVTCVRE